MRTRLGARDDLHSMTLSDDHDALLARGRRLEIATIAWNVMEVFVTIGLGIAAGSLALIAFGLDSIVEVFASAVAIWYIAQHHEARRSPRALRMVAGAFAVLAVYLFVASAVALTGHQSAASSPWGIAYLAITAAVMFGLAQLKATMGRAANSAPLRAEAAMTFLDGCLATGVLVALVLNAAFGLWWADPAAAALVGAAAVWAALDAWRASNDE
jgi:divalent metal cation (Fe/Co/Zn/Cd) transporter